VPARFTPAEQGRRDEIVAAVESKSWATITQVVLEFDNALRDGVVAAEVLLGPVETWAEVFDTKKMTSAANRLEVDDHARLAFVAQRLVVAGVTFGLHPDFGPGFLRTTWPDSPRALLLELLEIVRPFGVRLPSQRARILLQMDGDHRVFRRPS
jgi:hypothetical protein